MLGPYWFYTGVRAAIDGTVGTRHFVDMAKLTEKQEKFAQAVGVRGLSQSDAYRSAYSVENMTDKTVHERASHLAAGSKVKTRIMELTKKRVDAVVNTETFNIVKLFETYIAIAFVDPNELIAQKVGACRHCWGVGGRYQWKEREYVEALAAWERQPADKAGTPLPMPDPAGGFGYRFTAAPNPECVECEGEGLHRVVPMDTTKLSPGAKLLYRGVQQTKDGVKVLFANQDKALEQIGRILGAFDDKLRVDLAGKVASLRLTTTDPKEAAEAYAKMVDGGGN